MTWKKVPDEFTIEDIGARLLANLAKGIYDHEAVLREYVQNACDAYNELPIFPPHPTINIRVLDEHTISIQDNGIGMDEQRVRECKAIAYSPKDILLGEMTGFRGIGIWAGFQACDRLEIETTKVDVPARYRLSIDFAEIYKHVNENINIKLLLDNRFSIEEDVAEASDHYTVVKLIGLQREYQSLTNVEELRRIVSRNLPCKIDPKFGYEARVTAFLHQIEGYQEFPILVEGGEVFKCFPSDLREPVFETLRSNEEEYARCWYCSDYDGSVTPRGFEYRSFRLRIRNFAVGRAGIYDDQDGSSFGLVNKVKLNSPQHLNWHVGEIHITNSEIRPDTPRNALELDHKARRAIEEVRRFYEERIAESRALGDFKKAREVVARAAKAANDPNPASVDEIDNLLGKLREQEAESRARGSKNKTKKYLKQLLSGHDVKSQRSELIDQLSAINGSGRTLHPCSPALSSTSDFSGSIGQASSASPALERTKEQRDKEFGSFDPEQFLSDIIAVVESKFTPGDELIAELCEGIQSVFMEYGLIDAKE